MLDQERRQLLARERLPTEARQQRVMQRRVGVRLLKELGEELALVRNFDFLLKKRYEDNFRLNCILNGQPGYIMPLTLQILVENAVKHNIISKAKPLTVDIFVENNGYLVVRNDNQRKIKPEPGTHFGLNSLVHRYQLLGAKPIVVEDTDAYFTVKVPIL